MFWLAYCKVRQGRKVPGGSLSVPRLHPPGTIGPAAECLPGHDPRVQEFLISGSFAARSPRPSADGTAKPCDALTRRTLLIAHREARDGLLMRRARLPEETCETSADRQTAPAGVAHAHRLNDLDDHRHGDTSAEGD